MKHTDDSEKNEAELDIDQLHANPVAPTGERTEVRHIDLGNTQAERTTMRANEQEVLAGGECGPFGDPVAADPDPARGRRGPRQSRNHKLLDLLTECREEPYAGSIVITRSAFNTGMHCARWKNMELLYDALPVLADIADQVADIDDEENVKNVEMAMRRQRCCRSIMYWGNSLALPHHHDVHDKELGITLRIHFATDIESRRVIVGWIEEVVHGEAHARNAVAMSATIET